MIRLLFIVALLLPVVSVGQPLPNLVTDRPDFTESGVVVPVGHVQVESGFTWESDGDDDTINGLEILVRWTPISRVELRFGVPDYVGGDGTSGFSDGSLGLKIQIGPFASWDLGLIATFSVPVGASSLTTGVVHPEIILTTGREIDEWLSLGGQVVVCRDGLDKVWAVGGTAVAGIALSERWGAFFEAALTAPEGEPTIVMAHHGYTYAVSHNVQLDIHGGLGLTDTAPDALVGAGFSARF